MFEKQKKAIKHIQNMASDTEAMHSEIESEIAKLKADVQNAEGYEETVNSEEYHQALENRKNEPEVYTPLEHKTFDEIFREADENIHHRVGINDILTPEDIEEMNRRINSHIEEFNREYSLDLWDYAIAGSCGLLAAMLDILCVKAPLNPTTKFDVPSDGVFNRVVQDAFNKIIPPDLSHKLSESFKIGSADTSVKTRLKKFLGKLTPRNHRLKELSHDPVLGFIFGALDIIRNTCTIVEGGKIKAYDSVVPNNFEGNIFHAMGQMLGHLVSDINAPSPKGNRGMGLPAPFMGLLSMLRNVKINGESVGDTVEYMYLKGYDARQFVATSIPCAIMEILLRVCWCIKRTNENKALWPSIKETAPLNIHKKFRIIIALSYGVLCSVNAGKVYITDNILNLNYAAWMGLVWNGFHALKWALFDKHFELWTKFEEKELKRLNDKINKLDELEHDAERLPV